MNEKRKGRTREQEERKEAGSLRNSGWLLSSLYGAREREQWKRQIESNGGVLVTARSSAAAVRRLGRRFYLREWHLEPSTVAQERAVEREEDLCEKLLLTNADPSFLHSCLSAGCLLSRSLSATPTALRRLHEALPSLWSPCEPSADLSQSLSSFLTALSPERDHFGPSLSRPFAYLAVLEDSSLPPIPLGLVPLLSRALSAFLHLPSLNLPLLQQSVCVAREKGEAGILAGSLFYPVAEDSLGRLLAPDLLSCLTDLVPTDGFTFVLLFFLLSRFFF